MQREVAYFVRGDECARIAFRIRQINKCYECWPCMHVDWFAFETDETFDSSDCEWRAIVCGRKENKLKIDFFRSLSCYLLKIYWGSIENLSKIYCELLGSNLNGYWVNCYWKLKRLSTKSHKEVKSMKKSFKIWPLLLFWTFNSEWRCRLHDRKSSTTNIAAISYQ